MRWVVLLLLLLTLITTYRGWLLSRPFTRNDNLLRAALVTAAQIQFVLGLALYFISPVVDYFLKNFSTAIHEREPRFFGMEHGLMMLVAVGLITTGSSAAQRKNDPRAKFKTMAIWCSIALVIIFFSIPWPFLPFTVRPYFRVL